MRSLRAVLVALPMFAACGGDDSPGDAAGVFPENGFVGRTLRVEVTGDTTNWGAGSTVNFGDGVTVNTVDVVSPQALQVDLTINATAAVGKTDVTVTSGSDTFTLPQAFELQNPFTTQLVTFEQGGLGQIQLTNLDLLHPFDTTTDANTGAFLGTSINVVGADGVGLSVVDVTASTVTLSALIDVHATTSGTLTLTSNGPDGMPISSPIDTVPVTPRTPQVITAGTAANFTVAANGSLLEITAATAGLLNTRMSTQDMSGSAACPGFVVMPASGKWSDVLVGHQNFGDPNADAALDNRFVAAGDKFYIIGLENPFNNFFCVFNGSTPGYPATFDAKVVSTTGVTAVTDTGTNDTPVASQAATLTSNVAEFDGILTDETDVDCFKVAMAANQKAHVYTTDEDGASDTQVFVFANATQASLTTPAPVATSTDADLGEEVTSAVLVAPLTRSICIAASPASQGCNTPPCFTNAPYKAVVVLEN